MLCIACDKEHDLLTWGLFQHLRAWHAARRRFSTTLIGIWAMFLVTFDHAIQIRQHQVGLVLEDQGQMMWICCVSGITSHLQKVTTSSPLMNGISEG